MKNGEVVNDSLFSSLIDFQLDNFTTLQMLGIITAKNNMIVGLAFPRVNYLHKNRTVFSAGTSLGSTHRGLLGIAHAFSPSLTLGA